MGCWRPDNGSIRCLKLFVAESVGRVSFEEKLRALRLVAGAFIWHQ
jgi:hypothetical protein